MKVNKNDIKGSPTHRKKKKEDEDKRLRRLKIIYDQLGFNKKYSTTAQVAKFRTNLMFFYAVSDLNVIFLL